MRDNSPPTSFSRLMMVKVAMHVVAMVVSRGLTTIHRSVVGVIVVHVSVVIAEFVAVTLRMSRAMPIAMLGEQRLQRARHVLCETTSRRKHQAKAQREHQILHFLLLDFTFAAGRQTDASGLIVTAMSTNKLCQLSFSLSARPHYPCLAGKESPVRTRMPLPLRATNCRRRSPPINIKLITNMTRTMAGTVGSRV